VTFHDLQALQLLQRNLIYVLAALEANIDVLQACKRRCQDFPDRPDVSATFEEIDTHERATRFHAATLRKLMQQAKGTTMLVRPPSMII
jgi:Mg2+ and Co2+ transporter CorA